MFHNEQSILHVTITRGGSQIFSALIIASKNLATLFDAKIPLFWAFLDKKIKNPQI
jgi:hypothetical protein